MEGYQYQFRVKAVNAAGESRPCPPSAQVKHWTVDNLALRNLYIHLCFLPMIGNSHLQNSPQLQVLILLIHFVVAICSQQRKVICVLTLKY